MSCQILAGKDSGACFYCSTSGWAFGPVMGSEDEAALFLSTLPVDPRELTDGQLESRYHDFVRSYVCECGALRDEYDAECKAGDDHPRGCLCGNNGGGDCDWCQAKRSYLDPSTDDDRFVCHSCVNLKQDRWIEVHG